MRVLVTGHHGYIGSVLAPLSRTRARCRRPRHLSSIGLRPRGAAGRWSRRGLDIRDVRRRCSRVSTQSCTWPRSRTIRSAICDPELDVLASTREGGQRSLEPASEAGVRRFVFASSCTMYGAVERTMLLDENAPLRPLTPYAESKVRAEEALLRTRRRRLRRRFDAERHRVRRLAAAPARRRPEQPRRLGAHDGRDPLLSDGTSWRPLVHIRDIASVAFALLEAPAGDLARRSLQHRLRRRRTI